MLRVLEEKEFQPLGSTQRIKTNSRIIAATNRDLEQLVKQSRFRQDLYYRVNVIRLHLPPLKDRIEDVDLLTEHFISKINNIKGRSVTGIEPDAMALLLAHDYPGNIRELENIIEHGFVLCSGEMIEHHHLPAYLRRKETSTLISGTKHTALQEAERQTILNALKICNYNRSAVASHLGMHKSTLFRKIKKLQIPLPVTDGRHSKIPPDRQ